MTERGSGARRRSFDWWGGLGRVLASVEAVRDGRIQRGQKVILEGIGGGFAWGATLLRF